MTPTNEDLLALADRLDEGRSHCGHCGAEAVEQNSRGQYICVACLRENLVRVAHSLRYEAAAALRAIGAERQAIRADRLEAQEALLREAVAVLERCPPTSNPTLSAEYHLERINAWWRLDVRPALAKIKGADHD